jgi:hypothetical protein
MNDEKDEREQQQQVNQRASNMEHDETADPNQGEQDGHDQKKANPHAISPPLRLIKSSRNNFAAQCRYFDGTMST